MHQTAGRPRVAAPRDRPCTFYMSEATYAALNARSVEEERSRSATAERIIREALKDDEPAGNGLEVTTIAGGAADVLEG
jgi:hypothetical protein